MNKTSLLDTAVEPSDEAFAAVARDALAGAMLRRERARAIFMDSIRQGVALAVRKQATVAEHAPTVQHPAVRPRSMG